MQWTFIILVALWLIGAVAVFSFRHVQESRGRRKWRQWMCPDCNQPFGASALLREWRRKKSARIPSPMHNGPVIRCARCGEAFWCTWSGRHLPTDYMQRHYEMPMAFDSEVSKPE